MLLPLEEYRNIADKMPILTVDGIIVKNGKYLLLKRKNEPLKGQFWTPGGRVYKGERLEFAFRRKMKEETGLSVKIIARLGFYEDFYRKNNLGIKQVHTVSVIFLATPISGTIKLDNQSLSYRWVDKLPKRIKEAIHDSLPCK